MAPVPRARMTLTIPPIQNCRVEGGNPRLASGAPDASIEIGALQLVEQHGAIGIRDRGRIDSRALSRGPAECLPLRGRIALDDLAERMDGRFRETVSTGKPIAGYNETTARRLVAG